MHNIMQEISRGPETSSVVGLIPSVPLGGPSPSSNSIAMGDGQNPPKGSWGPDPHLGALDNSRPV